MESSTNCEYVSCFVGFDIAHPVLLVLDCETNPDLYYEYQEKQEAFNLKLQDVKWLKTQKFFIIDGAHRHYLSKKYGFKQVCICFPKVSM
jgi:hypothetical protein